MPDAKTGQWATHCDTEVQFFKTEEAANSHAIGCIQDSRDDAFDGWDEDLTEGICVMKVVSRAQKVDPNVPYQCVEYQLKKIEDEKSAAAAVRAPLLELVSELREAASDFYCGRSVDDDRLFELFARADAELERQA